uniref:NBS-LRR disease resistance protein n=1 Tax=Dasypyrum villosum TaxID=40247 RepID=A0A8K1MG04_9POAL|nr:NBS-LRR disease resistance protein [Dasypyrum villosum]
MITAGQLVLLAVTKIDGILLEEATKGIIAKLSEKVTNLKELSVKVETIKKQLIMMGNVIRQIDTVYLTDKAVKSWIWEVRKVAYQVEDVMDKYSYRLRQLQKRGFLRKFFIKGIHYAIVFTEITDEVVEVEKEIQLVIQMKEQWLQPSMHAPDPLTEMERHRYQDSFPEFVKDGDLVGIENNRIWLTRWLYSEETATEKENTVITVSGMGGLGKSTLVSNVYEREKMNFPAHAWIVVSQAYTVDALLRKLLWKIGYTEQPLSVGIYKMDVFDLKKEIQQRLKNRNSLIVLDDVWEQDVCFQIHDALQDLPGSRIIITTRKDHVAGISSPTRHLELQPLSNSDAFDLFCRRAFHNRKGHICPEDFEMIATSIVDRCLGLPLAIVTIGGMLSSRQRLDIWTQIYNQLRSELSNNDHIRAIFTLSYHDLPYDLRLCSLYCCLFPEDYHMSRESLVRLWVAEGFVVSKEKITPEMVAEGNLMELIHRNMLQVVECDELGRVNTCKMHDIVRAVAMSIAKEERFASADDYATMLLVKQDKDVRRLSSCGWKDDTAVKVKLPHLRTLVSLGGIVSSPGMLSSILSESIYLTVLELQDSEITEVPASIGRLFNLRYIGLRRTKIKLLPNSIEDLSNLHTLDIKQTRIEKLPRGIVKIKKLRHLLADRYDDEKQTEFQYFIGVQAPKELSNLEELQTLETVQSSFDLAEQLKKLMQLRSVWIDNISAADCANLFATLSTMPLLSCLLLSARDENEVLCLEALQPSSKYLHRLIIRGQWAKGTLNCPIFLSHGKYLKYLSLSWCHLGEDPLGMLAPHMPNLTFLKLNHMRSAKTLVLSADSFPKLKTLVLKQMPDVSELNIFVGAVPCLEGLYIVSMPKLNKVPQGIESLCSLKKLWLLSLHEDFRTQWDTKGKYQTLHVPEVRV